MNNPRDLLVPLYPSDVIDAIDLAYEDLVEPTLRDSLLLTAGDYQPHVRDRITALYHEAVTTLAVLTAALELAAKTQTGGQCDYLDVNHLTPVESSHQNS